MAERNIIGWGDYMLDALERVLPKPPPPHDTGYVPLTATALAEDPVVVLHRQQWKNSPLFRLLIYICISEFETTYYIFSRQLLRLWCCIP